MSVPLNMLIQQEKNIYELTCAIIKRAQQITVAGDEEIEKHSGKVVTTALNQVLNKKVEYRLEA